MQSKGITNTLITVSLLAVFPGCATNAFQSAIDTASSNGVDIVTRNPELDAVAIAAAGTGTQFCFSPETDAIPIDNFGLSTTVKVAPPGADLGNGSLSASGGAGSISLGGVTPGVLISREILFRTCEFTINQQLDQAAATDLFKSVLAQVVSIAENDTAQGSKSVTEAEEVANN